MELAIENVKIIKELKVYHSFTVFPDGLNYFGTLFGGKVLAEMDIAAAKAVRRLLYNTPCNGAATGSIDRVDFLKPGKLGDIIEITAQITRLGRTSIDLVVEVAKEDDQGQIETICNARFTFVSMKDGKPAPHLCVLQENG